MRTLGSQLWTGSLGDLCREVKGSQVLSECCKVGYSATWAKAQGHNFKDWGKVLVVEGSECTIKWQTKRNSVPILLEMCF